MRFRGAPLLALLAMTVLVGCTLRPKKIEVWADVVPNENRVKIRTGEEYHDSVVVEPGERIAWVCHCPPGTEFAVEDLHYEADLHKVHKMVHRRVKALQDLESLSQQLVSVQGRWTAQLQVGEDASGAAVEQPMDSERLIASAYQVINELLGTLAGEKQPSLFERGSPPSGFVDGRSRIRSGRVAKEVGDGLWKFTWRVRLKGDQSSQDKLDPHIFTHPDLDG